MYFITRIPGIIIAITLHEFIKAFVSTSRNDILPRRDGRLTLNPLKHLEPIGFLFFMFYGYGWGKPVKTAPIYYSDRKKDTILTYVTPVLANLLLAFIFSVLCNHLPQSVMAYQAVRDVLAYVVVANVSLAVFNLVPVYPMGCNAVLKVVMSSKNQMALIQHERMMQIILLALMVFHFIDPFLNPIVKGIVLLFGLV